MPLSRDFPYAISDSTKPFDRFASVNIGAGVTATVVEFRARAQMRIGYITRFGHAIDDVSAFATSVFRILVSRTPVPDYGNIQDQIGEFHVPSELGPIILPRNTLVTLEVTNNSVGAHLYGMRVRGFYDFGVVVL